MAIGGVQPLQVVQESGEVGPSTRGVSAVIPSDRLHRRAAALPVFEQDGFRDTDVRCRRQGIPGRCEALAVVAPVHLHDSDIEIAPLRLDQAADGTIGIVSGGEVVATPRDVQRPRPWSPLIRRFVQRNAGQDGRIDAITEFRKGGGFRCAGPTALALDDGGLTRVIQRGGTQPPGTGNNADKRLGMSHSVGLSRGPDLELLADQTLSPGFEGAQAAVQDRLARKRLQPNLSTVAHDVGRR